MPELPQPLIGQNEPGTLKASYPTPASDVALEGNIEQFTRDYLQGIYGQPPPKNTNPGFRLVNEVPIDWRYFKRKYVQDRTLEDTYNASISYSSEASDFPIFTRDYIVRRANYVRKDKLTTLQGLVNATVSNPGSGYTFASVVFSGGTGSGGAAIAIVDNGTIGQLVITAEGNYTVVPTISIVGDGSGATGTVSLQPATALLVKEDYIRQPDNDLDGLYVLVRRIYETLPGPVLSGTHIHEIHKVITDYTKQVVASGTVVGGITGAGVTQLVITDPGNEFTGNPTLTFSAPPSGVTATGTATFSAASPAGKLGTVTLTQQGGNYTSPPSVAVMDTGSGSGATVQAVLVGSNLASIQILSSDSGFTGEPVFTITDSGTGSGATASGTLTATTVQSAAVDSGGTGYTMATITFSGGGGTGAAATANLVGGVVDTITIDNAGSGYTSRPLMMITGDGTGASAHSILTGTSLATATITGTGFQYQNPSATVTDVDGSGSAMLKVFLFPTVVQGLFITNPGASYTAPSLAFSGGGGSGAAGTAALATGEITGVAITNPGSGYTSSPTITITGGGGTGAVISAVIGGLTWVEVEPLTAVKDMVMRTTVRVSQLPAAITLPQSFRVERTDSGVTTLIIINGTDDRVAVGMNDIIFQGGSGPVLAFRDELYMTDSQLAAYIPGVFSITGKSKSFTMYVSNVDSNGFPQVWTFRPVTRKEGSTIGIIQLGDERIPYGVRFVSIIRLTQDY